MPKKRSQLKKIIAAYQAELHKLGITVQKTILYGSYAQHRARDDSDIDLLVISDDFNPLNLRERLEILGIAAARIMMPIEAQGYTFREVNKISPASFLREVLATGIVF